MRSARKRRLMKQNLVHGKAGKQRGEIHPPMKMQKRPIKDRTPDTGR